MKKRFSLKFAVFMLLVMSMCTVAFANDDVLMDGSGFFDPVVKTGDVNLDGNIDVNDALLVLNHSMFPDEYPITYTESLDFNADGSVNALDATRLLQYSLFPDIYPLT